MDEQNPTSLVIDVESRNIYWTDAANNTIETANLDGTGQRTLIDSLDDPRTIALDTAHR